MSKKNFKRTAALMLVATMTVGSAMTVFADSTAVGTGTYEGKDGEKPEISITLPTDAELATVYNYHADPNDLIGSVVDSSNGSLGSSVTIDDATNKGILFETDTADTWGGTSKKFEVTSENMRDVDITVAVKVKEAGDASIEYADTDTFETSDTTKKLYLAIVNGESGDDAKSAALTADGVKLTQTAAGAADNYELKYDSTNSKYVYEKKGSGSVDDTAWSTVGFAMTGALNMNAEWGEGIKFPTLEVTWSFAEHTDSVLDKTTISGTANVITVNDGIEVTAVALIKKNTTTETTMKKGTNWTFTGGKMTVPSSLLNNNVGGKLKLTLSNGTTEEVDIQ